MAKNPYIPLYTGDWLKDPALTLCEPATRGIWMDMICAMHELDRSGELRGTNEQLARIARCSTVQLTQALTELQVTRAADIAERNGVVTVTNRRMKREAYERVLTKNRVNNYRTRDPVTVKKRLCNGDVTPIDNESDAEVLKKDKGCGEKEKLEVRFMRFWDRYPKKEGKGSAEKAFFKIKPDDALLVRMLNSIEIQKVFKKWDLKENYQFIPHPSTWLNDKRWEDDHTGAVSFSRDALSTPIKGSF